MSKSVLTHAELAKITTWMATTALKEGWSENPPSSKAVHSRLVSAGFTSLESSKLEQIARDTEIPMVVPDKRLKAQSIRDDIARRRVKNTATVLRELCKAMGHEYDESLLGFIDTSAEGQ